MGPISIPELAPVGKTFAFLPDLGTFFALMKISNLILIATTLAFAACAGAPKKSECCSKQPEKCCAKGDTKACSKDGAKCAAKKKSS